MRQVSLDFLFEPQREPWLSREKIQRSQSLSVLSCLRGGGGGIVCSLPLHRKGACKLITCEHPEVLQWPLLLFICLNVFENVWNLGAILVPLR